MADYTKHLRLIKPSGNEYYDVENFNHNAELIDKETEGLSNKVAKIQEGATRAKPGIVQFGTEEGKALEGMMLARLAGCVGYGGDIQEPGVKDVNYIYYDRNTRKMYKCLNQNSDVSANVSNFIPLDNNSLLERLENLSKPKEYKIYERGTLKSAFNDCLNKQEIDLIQFPNASNISELRAANINGTVEAIKIINNVYGMRWLIWSSPNLYYAFAFNSTSDVLVKKII